MIGRRRSPEDFGFQEAAELAGLLAALSRAGLPPGRTWHLLAAQPSAVAGPAGVVAGMLALGGTVTEGLGLAADQARGDGAQVLRWLRVTAQVAQHTGAPGASVYDGLVQGIHDELEQKQEAAVALAGPQATARVLGALPLAGFVLAMLIGVNTVAVLAGTVPGWGCLLAGTGFWLAGQRWIRRLMRSVEAGR